MKAHELRSAYLAFFQSKGHTIIPSAPLIPEHDPTVLFTTAGMHPLVPYLLGESHPGGKRLVDVQKCFRTTDIDDIGDDTHLTFFEMLGNWSLGDYFKKEAIAWSWEFLTNILKLDPERLYITCYAGDDHVPKDIESAELWQSHGVLSERIAFLGREHNWWGPAGKTGPCGPDTEMYYQISTTRDARPGNASWPKGEYVEIWNNVFMQYQKNEDGTFSELEQKNVDTGMGLERTAATLQGVSSVYETDLLQPAMDLIRSTAQRPNERSVRIITDHVRSSLFLLSDDVVPSNKEQGYMLRRLIRKSVREASRIGFPDGAFSGLLDLYIGIYANVYPEIREKANATREEFATEAKKFRRTLQKGLKVLKKEIETLGEGAQAKYFPGKVAFDLYQSYGFPREMVEDELNGLQINEAEWDAEVATHQSLSRKGAEQKFHGGLADHSSEVIRMHTATHLLHQALRDVLGTDVFQKGSNITKERLRFDFNYPYKLTDEQRSTIENIVNEKISADLPVHYEFLTVPEAKQRGAVGLFDEKYGEKVKVYFVGDYSKEFCGGPHVEHTSQIKGVKITKEESVGAGLRRIKAVLTDS